MNYSNSHDYHHRNRIRHRGRLSRHLPTLIVLGLIVLLIGIAIFVASYFLFQNKPIKLKESLVQNTVLTVPAETSSEELIISPASDLVAQADILAAGYDYEKAISLLTASEYSQDPIALEAVSRYEAAMENLVEADPKSIPHVFFHTLVTDTALAFDNDQDSKGYNSVMTTESEFMKILEKLYSQGYVLVRLHDIAYEEVDENGNPQFVWGKIILPEGKKPIVISQDDVCYYDYMLDDGFPSRLVIGQDGKVTCEKDLPDGTTSIGAYDMIPLLEQFVQEHPDFSYRGARAVIAVTGYQGIFGYRTSSSYSSNPTYEEERQKAAQIAQCLRDTGWELASHSWGHLKLGLADSSAEGNTEKTFAIEDTRFTTDTDKWEAEVESLIGPTDILIYPFGNDISDFHPYTDENSRFRYLMSKGFRYFCNVDASTPAWMQKGADHFRMARRNLDGYRLYYDMTQEDPAKKRLADLFDSAEIFDSSRPTPVTWY